MRSGFCIQVLPASRGIRLWRPAGGASPQRSQPSRAHTSRGGRQHLPHRRERPLLLAAVVRVRRSAAIPSLAWMLACLRVWAARLWAAVRVITSQRSPGICPDLCATTSSRCVALSLGRSSIRVKKCCNLTGTLSLAKDCSSHR